MLELESGKSLELGRRRLQRAEIVPLHSSLGNRVRLHLKKKKKELLNGFVHNTDNDMDNNVQAEVVSDGDEELVGNWSKGDSCYVLAKRLVTFFPCPRNL